MGVCAPTPADAGTDSAVDTGAPDTGTPDTGAPDTGVPDTGVPDTGVPDTTPADTAVADTAVVDSAPVFEAAVPADANPPPVSGTFQTCKGNPDCPSGFCVDGVCCDSACKDGCHSCALPGTPGVCTVVPIGTDPRGDCGGPGSCSQTCGAGGQCVPTAGGNECAPSKCTAPTLGIGPAFCSAAGSSCPQATSSFDCTPYLCEPAFGGCRGQCNDSTQCAAGYTCDTGKCVIATPPASSSGGCDISSTGRTGEVGLAFTALALAAAKRRRSKSAPRAHGD